MIGVAFKGDETIIKSDQHVYQWDTGQKIMVSGLGDSNINQVHFSFNGLKTAYPVNVTNSSGTVTVNIPNIVLRYGKDVYMYLCIKNTNGTVVTIKTVIIPVIKRNMPENYMYDDNETVAVKLDELQTEIQRSTAVDTEHETRITSLETSSITVYPAVIWDSNYTSHITDINAMKNNVLYRLQIKNANILNLPTDYKDGTTPLRYFIKIKTTFNNKDVYNQYILSNTFNVLWWRQYYYDGNTKNMVFSNWNKVENEGSITVYPAVIWDSNYTSHITDINAMKNNVLYRLQIKNANILNLPTDYKDGTTPLRYFIKIKTTFNNKDVYNQYILSNTFNVLWWRQSYYSGDDLVLSDWETVETSSSSTINTIHCGEGYEYTTLRSAIAKGTELGCKVIVYPGTYDLTEEFADVLSAQSGKGCVLGNGIEVVFMPGSKVTANVPSSNTWAYTNFEPFSSSGDGSFTLDGLNIETSNTRYCVHDEHSGSGTYKHIYRNCNMKTTSDTSHTSYPQCIGGGLGEHGYIEIVGGTYESAISDENLQLPITYHNGQSSTCQSRIDIRNVYLKNKGKFRFTHYGTSTLKTLVNVNNCSMGGSIIIKAETTSSTTVNIELLEFNNVIR